MKYRQFILFLTIALTVMACSDKKDSPDAAVVTQGVSYKRLADSLYTVLVAERAVYAKLIVNRLVNEENVIKASEHWKDEKALLLPAQFFRAGAEKVQESDAGFFYSLISDVPINQKNITKTKAEKEGVQFINDNPGKNYYGEETLGNKTYFTAIYPDVAVAEACVTCHNEHKDSPKTDFEIGDTMGGIIIRIPM